MLKLIILSFDKAGIYGDTNTIEIERGNEKPYTEIIEEVHDVKKKSW